MKITIIYIFERYLTSRISRLCSPSRHVIVMVVTSTKGNPMASYSADIIVQSHDDRIHTTLNALNDRSRHLLSTIKEGALEDGVLVLSDEECAAAFAAVDAAGLFTTTLG